MHPPVIAHDLPFDPTYGYDLAMLGRIGFPVPPVDFADFWRGVRALSEAVPLRLERRSLAANSPGWRLSEVYLDVLGGHRVGAWLQEPEQSFRAGMVIGHGYGGRSEAPRIDAAWSDAEPMAMLFPCAPGFNLSASPRVPDNAAAHVLHGISDRNTYILRDCVASLWAATRALATVCPSASARLAYEGVSFGGGLGALALPWEPRWRCARLDVPTFGHHPLRLRMPCQGSGESVRQYHAKHPEVVDVLAYYDAATAASFAHTPTLVAAAAFDPAVPPPGQWAVANALPQGDVFPLIAGHWSGPWQAEEERRLHAAWVAFLQRWLSNPQDRRPPGRLASEPA